MQTVVLVGGVGTRLGALVEGRNKPMVPIAGRPFLEYLLRQLARHGFTEVILCVGHRGEIIREHFGSGAPWGLQLRYSWEQELRGTAGALKLAQELIDQEPFLVMNGDSFLDIDLNALVQYHCKQAALATLALAEVDNTQRYGTVEVDERGQIRRFVEKGQGGKQGRINGGIYVFQKAVLDDIPAGRAVSLEHETFPSLIGRKFYGLPVAGYFVDIGIPATYLDLQSNPDPLLTTII
jgi:NDP-sugar pyrophosphorylase family protein